MTDADGTLRVQSDTFVRSGDPGTFVVLSNQMRSPGESLTLELAEAVGQEVRVSVVESQPVVVGGAVQYRLRLLDMSDKRTPETGDGR
jgi:hypothetical protein